MSCQNNWTTLWIFHCFQSRNANANGVKIRGLKVVESIEYIEIKLLRSD